MRPLPDRPHLDNLKKQAKDLLAAYRRGEPEALARFRASLPAASSRHDQAVKDLDLRLHDAQSCLAREYGFRSWSELKDIVIARDAYSENRADMVHAWLRLIYASDISGGNTPARPAAAARMLDEHPDLVDGDAYLACAIGDEAALRQMTTRDPTWVNRPGGPFNLPPLVAVAHSSFLRLPEFHDRLQEAAKFLLDAGANPNQFVGNRWMPASLSSPDETTPLSALYGAAGQNRDPDLTKLLLDAGADPNDGESLYHSLENPACTDLLLKAGARVTGSNALYRVLDLDRLDSLHLLLAAPDADPNEPATSSPTADWGTPLLWAIRRGRSAAHIEALLAAGADASATMADGTSAYALALQFGLTDAAEILRKAARAKPLGEAERFIAACAIADESAARQIQLRRPDLPRALSEKQLRLLPEFAALGRYDAVLLMVRLGWPIAVRGGDWDASALNLAVFRGDSTLTRSLLEHGASWKEPHGFGGNVAGTLSWASENEPEGPGDWLGCAAALVAYGMPTAQPDPETQDGVILDGEQMTFSDDVTEFLLTAPRPAMRRQE